MNPYHVLGLTEGAKPEEIKHAYRTLAKRYHPDVNPSPDAADKFKQIHAAFEALTNPQSAPPPVPVYTWVRVYRQYYGATTSTTA